MNKIFLAIVLFIITVHSHASELRDITYAQFINSGLPSDGYPQLFLFDKQGMLIHYNEGLDRALKGRFKRTSAYHNSDNIVPALKNMIKLQTNNADFTLYTITKHNDENCPPCMKQEEITNKVIASLPEKNIKSVILTIDSSNIDSVLTEEERAKRFPNKLQ